MRFTRLLLGATIVLLWTLGTASGATAATCPAPNPVVNENACAGTGSTAWRLTNYDTNGVAGFATQPSVNVGNPVRLAIGAFDGANNVVSVSVYRIGYYGGRGGRLVNSATGVSVNNGFSCGAPDGTTGLVACDDWAPTYTIPASALQTSGVYIAVLQAQSGKQYQVLFVVRDDNRHADILYKLPTATYQAYNNWGNKSLYDWNSFGANTVSGGPRAAKVSFQRPLADLRVGDNWFMKADYAMVYWLEKQGYDVSYTEDSSVNLDPSQLLGHRVDLVAGHDEYWTAAEMHGLKAARDAGVSVASFSGNTGYWKTRMEDSGLTLVAYKTVQGSGTNGSAGQNDWGPDGVKGTADDALGADGTAGTADDRPQNATTSWRDNGAPPGSPDAPPGGRVGPDEPENSLLGNMYVGDNDSVSYPLTVPAGNGQGQFAADRIWRHTGIASGSATTIGSKLIGWEWDAIPTNPQYVAQQPAGVVPVSASDTSFNGSEWLQDEGRVYGASPPPGQPNTVEAVKYRAASGAWVFSAGTNQWSWGLGPHWIDQPGTGESYQDPPTDSSDARISQATYNILSDMNVQPITPVGLTLDSGNQPPTASFTATPNPALTGQAVTFDASASTDTDGSIVRYEWDLDGNGSYETTTTTPTTTHTYTAAGPVTVGLRVTDAGSATDTTTRSLSVVSGQLGPYPQAVLGTTGVARYWRLGDVGTTTLLDQLGASNATARNGVTLGVAGALSGDTDTAARFDGVDDAVTAPVDLSSTTQLTVEFWLKWNAYANDDRLAMEFTANFNQNAGGFLVDPNAPQLGGTFGVALGTGTSRNNVFFARPSAGAWHHYAFVMDTGAPGATQIVPYVDGVAVPYQKVDSGTGAGAFANATLNLMSRDGASLFGAGDLDEVALYRSALSASTIAAHVSAAGGGTSTNARPVASFTATPNPANTGQSVTFDASASSDSDGTIADYAWDLDGNGTYETDTNTTPTTSHTFTTAATNTIGLRVTDNNGATDTTTRTVTINAPTTPTTPYPQAVQATTGLVDYWRLGDSATTSLANQLSGPPLTTQGSPTLGVSGALNADPDTATRFDGVNDTATAPLNLSATSQLTIEFWLKWTAYANDDRLAMEFTPNFNQNTGGFIVDPNDSSGRFAVGIGRPGTTRNNVLFARPSAGTWHHYAFVIDTTAPAATQITPYVDGTPVTYTKLNNGTQAGPFANSTLYVMSRNASGLYGTGDLDELALYTTQLSPTTIANHYALGQSAPAQTQTALAIGQEVAVAGATDGDAAPEPTPTEPAPTEPTPTEPTPTEPTPTEPEPAPGDTPAEPAPSDTLPTSGPSDTAPADQPIDAADLGP